MSENNLERRYIRQSDIVPADRISEYTPIIIGCGAVGSMVARQLAHMGSSMTLLDFDTVNVENLSCQGFVESDLGLYKVDALAEHVKQINSSINVDPISKKMGQEFDAIKYRKCPVFCCVDKMKVRDEIFRRIGMYSPFFVDGRMAGGSEMRVLLVCDDASKDYYPTTLFSDEQAVQGSCTAKSTIYGAFVLSGLMVSAYGRWLKSPNCFFLNDVYTNLAAMQMFEGEPEFAA